MPPHPHQWLSPEQRELHRIQRNRATVCPRSPFLPYNFDLRAHKAALAAAESRRASRKLACHMHTIEARQSEQRRALPLPPAPLRPALDGKDLSTNHGAVLLHPTVFVPTYHKSRIPETVADWPSLAEMKYEGDERVSTERIHARFLPAPRVRGNGTVNWQQRTIVVPLVFDYFYTSSREEDVWERRHWIWDSEFADEEGVEAVGEELMGILDCDDIW